jgi:hypothetical protein
MATSERRASAVEATHPAHRHACEHCGGLYKRAGAGECGLIDHGAASGNGIVVYGYCDAVCYRKDRPQCSRHGQQVAEGTEP